MEDELKEALSKASVDDVADVIDMLNQKGVIQQVWNLYKNGMNIVEAIKQVTNARVISITKPQFGSRNKSLLKFVW